MEEDPRDPRGRLADWLAQTDGFLSLLDGLLAWSPGEVSRWLTGPELHAAAEAVAAGRLAAALQVLALALAREHARTPPAEPATWTDTLIEELLDDLARLDGHAILWADAVVQRHASIAWSRGDRSRACTLLAEPLRRLRERRPVPAECWAGGEVSRA